jgi:hypothetical protein
MQAKRHVHGKMKRWDYRGNSEKQKIIELMWFSKVFKKLETLNFKFKNLEGFMCCVE